MKILIVCVCVIAVLALAILLALYLKKKPRDAGKETHAWVSRIKEYYNPNTYTYTHSWYVRYRGPDGRMQEALLLNAENLEPGMEVIVKVYSDNPANVMFVRALSDGEKSV